MAEAFDRWRRPRRGPVLPRLHHVGVILFLQVFGGLKAQQAALDGLATPMRLQLALPWGLITCAAYACGFTGLLALHVMQARGHAFSTPRWRNWALFYGVLGVSAALGASLRAVYQVAWAPRQAGTPLGLLATLTCLTLMIMAILEWFAAERHELTERRLARERAAALLAASRAELVAADDAQRRELAELLHGRFQTQMVVASALLAPQDWLEPGCPRPRQAAAILAGLAEDALAEASKRGGSVEACFVAALHELVERFGEIAELRWELLPEAAGLPEPGPDALGLVMEALLNAYRHAGPCTITVTVGRDFVRVQDDGRGFQPGSQRRGLGLQGLAALGSQVELRSAPGAGTSVTLRLPLEVPR